MATVTAMDVWEASQDGMVRTFAMKLWGAKDRAEDGLQEAILRCLQRLAWFDPAKGRLTTWLMLNLKSICQAERSRGHRRGTVAAPRVFCPGDAEMPEDVLDLCDPESILIAREIDVDALVAKREGQPRTTQRKLTPEDAAFIRASKLSGNLLAARFNVSPSAISLVRKGKTYRRGNQ